MKILKNKYYFSVNECINKEIGEDHVAWADMEVTETGIFANSSVTSKMGAWVDFVTNQTNAIAYNFVNDYLATKVEEICFCSEQDTLLDGYKLHNDFRLFIGRFLEWWNETYNVYEKRISLYEQQKNNLMKGVQSQQTTTSDGTNTQTTSSVPTSTTYEAYPTQTDDVSAGAHGVDHSSTLVVSDVATEDVLDHLEKINDKLRNLYSSWLHTFWERFIILIEE